LKNTVVLKDGETKKVLYFRVENKEEIKKIELLSERWEPYGIGGQYGYIMMEQLKSNGRPTGYIKVIEEKKALIRRGFFNIFNTVVEAKPKHQDAWMYYKRRTVG
jgi:hypothetical protein